jgi:hypothetical protein
MYSHISAGRALWCKKQLLHGIRETSDIEIISIFLEQACKTFNLRAECYIQRAFTYFIHKYRHVCYLPFCTSPNYTILQFCTITDRPIFTHTLIYIYTYLFISSNPNTLLPSLSCRHFYFYFCVFFPSFRLSILFITS